MNAKEIRKLELLATQFRKLGLEAVRSANSGHIGGSFSIAEILAVLYFSKMNVTPENPKDEGRDRFVLSKGHCTPTTYAALALRGFFPVQDLLTFRKIDSYLSGHMEMQHVPGVDMSTGSLGQGLSAAVGMAQSAKVYGKNYRTFVITGDGEIEEGQIWEAVMYAGNHALDNLTVFVDNNNLQVDGSIDEINSPKPIAEKFRAFQWNAIEINGNDVRQVADAVDIAAAARGKPTVIVAHTVKGKGVSIFEGGVKWHGSRPNEEEYAIAFRELNSRIAELEE